MTKPLYKRIPWLVYALLAPLLIMGVYRLVVGSGRAVTLVGSGVLSEIGEESAPEGSRYVLDVVSGEAPEQSEARIMDIVSTWPDVVVFALDESAASLAETRVRLDRMATAAENAAAVPVIVGFVESQPWFGALCDRSSLRLCVEPGANPEASVAAAVDEAWQRHRRLEASTQVGR